MGLHYEQFYLISAMQSYQKLVFFVLDFNNIYIYIVLGITGCWLRIL